MAEYIPNDKLVIDELITKYASVSLENAKLRAIISEFESKINESVAGTDEQ